MLRSSARGGCSSNGMPCTRGRHGSRVVLKPGDRVRPAVVAEEDAALAVARPRLSRKEPPTRESIEARLKQAIERLVQEQGSDWNQWRWAARTLVRFRIRSSRRSTSQPSSAMAAPELSRPMAPATARSSTCRTGIARS